MGIIDIVRKFSERKTLDKQKFKEAETELKIQKTLEERQKSSNERELERYMKEQREANIKKELDKIHKEQNKELWKSKKGILDKGTSILKNDRPILKEKNIFLDNKNDIPFTKGGNNQFFKW